MGWCWVLCGSLVIMTNEFETLFKDYYLFEV